MFWIWLLQIYIDVSILVLIETHDARAKHSCDSTEHMSVIESEYISCNIYGI